MFLKRLEIQGFKSFPEKIRLDFKKGITGVVGPNGSGKSNISDAIRWVLGEQNARTLRGDKMEDIIFSGTKNRKPLGFAEVTIYLDNTDKKLPLEYSEVAITRKVYRSGESGYYINGTNCRLKDIHELFMDTGIGKEGYSIIGQGKIDAILSNKSEDRRALFEEAVGIIKFKNRRIQAENRLEEVRKNLVRTNDIISELERQVKPLFEQQEKAKEFLKLSEQLKIIKINLFATEYKIAENNITDILNNIDTLNNTILSLEQQAKIYLQKEENLKNSLLTKEKEIDDINNTIINLNINIEQNQNSINLDNQNINFIKEDITRIKDEQSKNNDLILRKSDEIKFTKVSLEAKILEYNIKKEELDKLYIKFEKMSAKMDKNEEEFKSINNKIVEKIHLSSEISNKLTIYKSSKDSLNEKLTQLEKEIGLYKSKINEKITRKMVLEKNLANIKLEEETISQNINFYNVDFEKNKTELINIKQINNEDNKKYIELKNKHKILKELEKDYEGYFGSVKAILKEKEKNNKFSGICSAIGELISVPKQYETAIEIALGGTIQNIVTNTEEDAKIAIDYLKSTKKGRATFLPISSIKSKPLEQDKYTILKETGVIGIADSLIKFDSKYSNVMSNILGRTIIIDSIDNAIALSKKYKYMYKVVTLDGELINTGGALTGGSISKKSGGIFSRGREIKDIFENICILEEKINKTNNTIHQKEEEQIEIQKNIEKNRDNLNKISLEKIRIESEVKQTEENIKYLENNIQNSNDDVKNINNKLKESYSNNNKLEEQLNTINEEIKILKENILIFESKLEEERLNKDTNFNYINKLQIDIKEIEYQIENNNKDIHRLNNDIDILKETNTTLNTKIKHNNDKQDILNKNIIYVQKNINDLKEKTNNLKNSINILQQEKTNINNSITTITNDISSINKNILDIENKKVKAEAKKENIEEKIQLLCDNMWQEYEITYASACNDYENINLSFDELKKEENKFKAKISSLGNVNVGAIEEYKIIKERYDLNIKQREDIIKADDDLKDIIATLITEMEEQFKKQFSLINKNFNQVFSDIFGGGKAELVLADEDSILTSGIDIVAQPPGKNLQNLNLLSGGERTLTAMSLLFAILIMKPSPFCVLDETEAALDDANVLKYANFLRKFSLDNQFILITHKTGTMEIADILYGVTMEEQGVSKVISVELKNAKEYENF
ncbi:chromosome segregation protein SMC [uncultured Tyzzerella sp.]|uniref:chromosome segregation protein SMC n=1 Tax=uncultured Tyzzerella sp. TaxID=2321398 RepID=UPI002941C11C|nr:chromosome segregation protein SMC [uncultured Tyzzerella sp.]